MKREFLFSSGSKGTISGTRLHLVPTNSPPASSACGSSIRAELRERTAEHHLALEKQIDVQSSLSSRASYAVLISRFFGLYLALEPRLMAVPEITAWLPDLPARRKAPLLLADVRALRVPTGRLAASSDLPQMTHVADAFGCLYVVEGSTLGGQIISRQVTRNLGLSPDNNGCRFFCCYGENTGTMWRRFGESLETFLTANPDTRPQIVASALSTFECFQGWFSKPSTGHPGI